MSKVNLVRGSDTRCQWFGSILNEKIKENIIVCVYCKMELAYHNSTTSVLQHLNRKHPFDDMSRGPETRSLQHKMKMT